MALPLTLQLGGHGAPLGQLALRLEDGVLPLAQLGLGSLQLVGGGGGLPLRLGQGLCPLGHPCANIPQLAVQPLQLVGSAQNSGAAAGRSAGHGAARVEHLAVQGDDAELIAILPGGGDGGVQILHNGHPAQQVGKDVLIPGVERDEPVGHPHEAGLLFQGVPLLEKARADGAEGQDGGPAPVPALQVLDDRLAVLLPVHHQVLHGPAQSGLDGHGVPVGHL